MNAQMLILINSWIVMQSCNVHEERHIDHAGVPTSDASANASAFAFLSQSLFFSECAGCHNTGRAAAGINLTSYRTIMSARLPSGVPLLNPGDASASALVQILDAGRMPPRKHIDKVLITAVRCWIDAQAPQNGAAECVPEQRSRP